ncbi:cell division protein SepF [Rothia kristinae]|uniref:cell division protein SepF n=1 Tax=Rothia kristinae TaxID=37923 RepID=UPI000C263B90|nr:cell division protein SepF [Rothia kristinae]WGH08706.1 cell division protein SepF [Rothia kristinae]
MAGTLRQAMVFLGLADDGYEQSGEQTGSRRGSAEQAPARTPRGERVEGEVIEPEPSTEAHPVITRTPARSSAQEQDQTETPRGSHADGRRPAALESRRAEREPRSRSAVQPAASAREAAPERRIPAPIESDNELRRITTIHPRSYNDAKVIGESFREGIPVIMNVTDMDVTEAKRLVDFSSGLTFALNGSIERVTEQVFLLTPATLEVLAPQEEQREQHAPEDDVAQHDPFDQR